MERIQFVVQDLSLGGEKWQSLFIGWLTPVGRQAFKSSAF